MKTKTKERPGDKYLIVSPFQFDDDIAEDGAVAIPGTIHLIPIGTWQHDLYGPIIIKNSDIREFAQNFNANIRKGVYITAGHEGFEELPAVGWIKSVMTRDDGLWGVVEWNEYGKEMLSDKQFKFFSPEFCREYEDPQTHEIYRNVLVGGALTKSPYFKELEAIVFSDKKLREQFSNNTTDTMNLEDILAKKLEELTDEEKAFLKENAASLTEEQKAEYTAILDAPEEAPETAPEATQEAPEATPEAPTETAPAAAPETVTASEKGNVMISASELAALRDMADKGREAYAELEKQALDTAVSKLTFSANNKEGKFLPKQADSLRKFMQGLSKEQRTAFSDLVSQLPKTFSEVGSSGAGEATPTVEIDALVDAKLKAKPTMKYSDALREVFAENEGLEERYDRSLTPVRGK